MRRRAFGSTVAWLAVTGCVTPSKDYGKFLEAQPRSILVVPAVNNTVDVGAPDYFLSTLPIPIAENGFYVFPVNLVKRIMEDNGLSDAGMVYEVDPPRLCALFGSDAVLYLTIERWDARYAVLSTAVTVEFDYVMKECQRGETIWSEHLAMVYTSKQQSSGNPFADLVAAAASAAITKAAPNFLPLAHQANKAVFAYPGKGFPPGPHLAEHPGEK